MTRQEISVTSNQETVSFKPFEDADVYSSIPVRFEKQVNTFPDSIAIKSEHHILTYKELNIEANRIAQAVLARDQDSSIPVIILTGYGSPTIIAMMGVLKTGKAHIIVDPSFPQDRIREILVDSQSNLIVTDEENIDLAYVLVNLIEGAEIQLVDLDKITPELPARNPGVEISPDTFANIFYTSGSTGKPKGVIRDHQGVLHSIANATNLYKITPADRLLLISSLSFGASTSDILGALLNGASVYPFPIKHRSFTQLTNWIISEGITMCHFVATSFRHFVAALTGDEGFHSVRMIRLGGEAIYKHDVELFKEYFPDHCLLRVGLASTESGSFCWNFIDKTTEITSEVVPVGKPVDGFEVLLLDENHQPVKPGQVGEIAVRSRFISRGYWRRPDLDAQKFLPDPEGGDKRICLTGDLGKFNPDGSLEHLTRKDTMVKIRGLRIEISEIEAILLEQAAIKEAVVVVQEDRFHEKRLVAYLVPAENPPPTILDLREVIAGKLPDYMVPASFVYLDSLPLTSSGKLNRLKLPAPPAGRLISGQEYLPPRDETEARLVEIFEKHLEVQPVGVRDDFFELGGQSLVAIRIVSEIEEAFQRSIPIPEFMETLTVEKLAQKLRDQDPLPSLRHVVGLQVGGSKPPLFCVPPSAATAMQAERLVKYLGDDQPFYGFEYAGMDGKSEPFSSIQMMGQAFVQELRMVKTEGPYYLCGLCFGGLVAFEMAQQLVASGQKVAFLGVLDSNFPPRRRNPLLYYYTLTRQFIANLRGTEYKIFVPDLERASRKFSGDDQLKKRFQHAFTVHHVARLGYASPPYPGLITRFATDSPHAHRATKSWRQATTVGLDLQMVPGGHGARKAEGQTSFMAEPNIQVLASKLNASLEKARINAG
jgi:amino acid adenylation domain-containing protein